MQASGTAGRAAVAFVFSRGAGAAAHGAGNDWNKLSDANWPRSGASDDRENVKGPAGGVCSDADGNVGPISGVRRLAAVLLSCSIAQPADGRAFLNLGVAPMVPPRWPRAAAVPPLLLDARQLLALNADREM